MVSITTITVISNLNSDSKRDSSKGFGQENLPNASVLGTLLGSDLTTWTDIYSAASVLVSECVRRLGTPGWTVAGKKYSNLVASKRQLH